MSAPLTPAQQRPERFPAGPAGRRRLRRAELIERCAGDLARRGELPDLLRGDRRRAHDGALIGLEELAVRALLRGHVIQHLAQVADQIRVVLHVNERTVALAVARHEKSAVGRQRTIAEDGIPFLEQRDQIVVSLRRLSLHGRF